MATTSAAAELRKCNKCEEMKSIKDFKPGRAQCRKCISLKSKEWNDANRIRKKDLIEILEEPSPEIIENKPEIPEIIANPPEIIENIPEIIENPPEVIDENVDIRHINILNLVGNTHNNLNIDNNYTKQNPLENRDQILNSEENIIINTKTCSNCKESKLSTEFSVGRNKCKLCIREYDKERAANKKAAQQIAEIEEIVENIENLPDENIIVPNGSKQCNGCNIWKLSTEFNVRQNKCKPCVKEQKKIWEQNRILKQQNPTPQIVVPEGSKLCKRCNKVQLIEEFKHKKTHCYTCQKLDSRNWKAKNPDRVKKYNTEYKAEHKEEISEYNSKYNIENRAEIQKRSTANMARLKKENPSFKIACNMRSRMKDAFKSYNTKIKKCDHTKAILGCSMAFLCEWFTFRFTVDMNFKNYGSLWHMDHVVPCCRFDLTDDDEQRKCFHWTNLKPMNGKENISKNGKMCKNEIKIHEEKLGEFIGEKGLWWDLDYSIIDIDRLSYDDLIDLTV
jgi:uncharacterized protein (DUF983 family)